MNLPLSRRHFLCRSALGAMGLSAISSGASVFHESGLFAAEKEYPLFQISLAQWSLNKALFGKSDTKLTNLEFPAFAREKFDIAAVEYVNQFFKDKAEDSKYLGELKQRAEDAGVRSLLIMVDGEGHLGDPNEAKRQQAIENHQKWIDAAAFLGCHSIRVNAASSGTWKKQMQLAADGLARLTQLAEARNLRVLVENHGGLSSNGKWLSEVIQTVNHPHCGTLPDFGNFRISADEQYDRYLGVSELMPYAKAVSAKSYDFDEQGNETQIDYLKMMKIVTDNNYRGFVGIEYEGHRLDEIEGIQLTKTLLERVREELTKQNV